MTDAAMPDGLPPLREVIETYGLAAKKSLGQNFLFDLNLTRKIARAAGRPQGAHVIEVGPGPGGLTRALLLEGAGHVTVIERDERTLPALAQISQHNPGRLTIVQADALTFDWQAHITPGTRIVSNLPYNVGTALLIQWLTLDTWPPPYHSLTLMFQKEVAQRITAKPGDAAFGRLSVLCQWRCETSRLFDVNRSAFTPPPKITSSIVHLVPRPQPLVDCTARSLERVTAAAFGQRRKMVRSSLKGLFADQDQVFKELGLAGTERAEDIAVRVFGKMAQVLDTTSG